MTLIHILTPELERIGLIDNYESFIMTRHYNKVGEFTLAIESDDENASVLQEDQLILIGTDKAKAGIIDNVEFSLDNEGKEIKKYTGRTLGTILNERLTYPSEGTAYDQVQGNVETVIRHYVNRNAVNAINSNRNFPYLDMVEDKMKGEFIRFQSRHKTLQEEVERLSEIYALGWHIYLDFDKGKWIFDVYEGRDLSVNQTEYDPVIFSTKYDNIQGIRYINNKYTEKNMAYVAADGEGESRNIYTLGNETAGLDRKEVLIELSAEEGEYLDPIESGQRNMAEKKRVISLEADINDASMFEYGVDYNLGDVVTVQYEKWNVLKDMRISTITESYDASGYKLTATFGDIIPVFADRLKQELKIFEPYIHR